ncbi:FxSxx-COOH system tetratricopeptide repeat protein [Streptomyces sp. NBC_00377]|uniref:FxSxx-COOH system tetratricopeptide repeat protein n=1 Tax=unclassified Streptomyces TaxID=2593676 RepID=UPI002E20D451|nr:MULTISPECIES: FxSxx-COOH system tetratricopeptide repeat protein [unclassified Streptomyces]
MTVYGAVGIFHGPVTIADRQPPTRLWNVPPRNRLFTGRRQELIHLHAVLTTPPTAAISALHGTGGVGKTSLAVEYAYRHHDNYDLVWWVPAENAALIPTELAGLAAALALTSPADPVAVAVKRLHAHLRDRRRWLLAFDNAEAPAQLSPFLPAGPGHVIITSRNPGWDDLAVPVGIDVLPRRDAVTLLRRRADQLPANDAASVAAALGGLPLALVQAGAFIATTGTTADRFLTLLRERTAALLDQDRPATYPSTLAGATGLTLDHIADRSGAAAQLLTVVAHLAPEPIPFTLITGQPHLLPAELATAATDELAFGHACRILRESGAVRVGPGTLEAHRLLAAIIRSRVPVGGSWRHIAASLVRNAVPADPWDNPATWPSWHTLLPHVLFVLEDDTNASLAPQNIGLATSAGRYLHSRGRARSAVPLLDRALHHYRSLAGPDDPATLGAACDLATALRDSGRLREALQLGADTLARCRIRLGGNHRLTLQMAGRQTAILWEIGQYPAAASLGHETWQRCHRILGPADPRTIRSAFILAVSLWDLGHYLEALRIGEDTLHHCRQSLGDTDPYALRTAMVVVAVLHDAGHDVRCEHLTRALLKQMGRTLGPDHPDRLRTRSILAAACAGLGKYPEALNLSRSALSRMRTVLGTKHTITLRHSRQHAALLHAIGRDQAASTLARRTHEMSQSVLGHEHPDTWSAAVTLASTTLTADPHRAAQLVEQARAEITGLLGTQHPLALRAAHQHMLAVAKTGDLSAAVAEGAAVVADLRQHLGADHHETMQAAAAYGVLASSFEPHNGQLLAAAHAAVGALRAHGLHGPTWLPDLPCPSPEPQ